MNKPDQSDNKTESPLKLNARLHQMNQYTTWGAVVIILVLILCVFLGIHFHQRHQKTVQEMNQHKTGKAFKMISLNDLDDLQDSATSSALEKMNAQQDATTKALNQEITALKAQVKSTATALAKVKHTSVLPTSLKHAPPSKHVVSIGPHPSGGPLMGQAMNANRSALGQMSSVGSNPITTPQSLPGVAVFHFAKPEPSSTLMQSTQCDDKHCILPGTFAQAVMIGGADANASVNGQSQTTPILFRILKPAILPNGHHINLKGCFVVGTVYGDISSERGEVKLTHLSCILHGHVVSKKIDLGTAYDIGGKEGIRGDPVMRNGPLLMYAGLSGFASGIGSAIQQSDQTQSISPLGVTTTTSPGSVFKSGAAGGASTALGKLASYYIKRADQYHPVIQLNPGSIVDVVFLSQINLHPDASKNSLLATPTHMMSSMRSAKESASLATSHFDEQMNQAMAQRIKQSIQSQYGEHA